MSAHEGTLIAMAELTSLVYNSLAVAPATRQSIDLLLRQAHARNAVFGITGMLLYDYGVYLQVLEGRRFEVEEIFQSILRDPRHTAVRVISRKTIPEREFQTWSMGYADVSLHTIRPPGFAPDALSAVNAESAYRYLRFFAAAQAPPGLPFI